MKKIAILLLALAPALCFADTAAAPRTLTTDVSAAGVNRLELSVGVGEVHVTISPDDSVHAQVTLKQKEQEFLWFFHWMSEGTAKEIADATLKQEKTGDALALSLDINDDGNNDDVKQVWQVQLPARLMLKTDMKVGELTVDGVAGGVDARLNVGELSINVPHGAVHGDVNVGELRVVSNSTQPGDLSVSSTIGEASIFMNGKFVSHGGEHSGIGKSLSIVGTGPDEMHLSVNVGEAMLKLVPATDSPTK
ncbi:MAG TPA: hypothetical protein VF184_06130 [Phycisphaeraceae bacterium]